MSSDETPGDLRVERNDERRRFEALIDDKVAGVAEFIVRGDDVVIFTHTEVSPDFGGQGVGKRLAAAALDAVRASGKKVQATCTFMGHYIREHDEYHDLVDRSGPPLAGA